MMHLKIDKSTDQTIRNKIYKLRYKCYHRAGSIAAKPDQSFSDEFDFASNAMSYLLSIDNQPIGSIRAIICSPEFDFQPTTAHQIYEQDIKTACSGTIVEGNRFVIDPDVRINTTMLHDALFHVLFANTVHYKADFFLAASRDKHIKYYQRRLKTHPISEPKKYPNIDVHMTLLALDMQRDFESLSQKHSWLRYTAKEAADWSVPPIENQACA